MKHAALGILSTVLIAMACCALAQTPRFSVQGEHFLRDGKPFLIRSGEIHYPRVPREYWRDRLHKLRAMGLNTITTYVFWNLHEPEPGQFDFSGNLDIAAFVRTAQEEGLVVIVRPGPYICTELDFGGYPAWLLRTPGLRVRSMDPRYMAASARYLKRVGEELAPLLSTRGGPILMIQVENEYGSYGNDRDYMAAVKQQVIDAGFDTPLFTSDGPHLRLLEGGTLPGVTSVINFDGDANDAQSSFEEFARFRTGVPRMVGEYWDGWFDAWGKPHTSRDTDKVAGAIEWFLANGVSFNLYMAHGGTSFGYLAGANGKLDGSYSADTTSYDYDAPIDEAGRLTPKYHAIRAVIGKHLDAGETLPPMPADARTVSIPRFELAESVSLRDALPILSKPVLSVLPKTMEALGQNYGFVWYRTRLPSTGGKLQVQEVRDYASVLVDGVAQGTLDRRENRHTLSINAKAGATLDLLVENMGRINFDQPLATEYKGITRAVKLDDAELRNWTMYALPLADLSGLAFGNTDTATDEPRFWRGSFKMKKPGDSFLDLRGWGKGHVWVNGHHLGRYWKIGPQQALYLPAPWLRSGRNEVVVLDVEGGAAKRSIGGITDPVYQVADPPAGQ